MTQDDLAKKTNIILNIQTMVKIAKTLNISIEELLK